MSDVQRMKEEAERQRRIRERQERERQLQAKQAAAESAKASRESAAKVQKGKAGFETQKEAQIRETGERAKARSTWVLGTEEKPPTPLPTTSIKIGSPTPPGLDPRIVAAEAKKQYQIDLRTQVIKPILDTLQAGSDFFESHTGFASEAEINSFLASGGRYKDPYKYAPKNAEELFSRLALAGTSGVKGALKDFTFPISWGLSPPKTKAQQSIEFMGAILIPSPADYVIIKTLSTLGRTVKGRILGRILIKGNAAEISENGEQILQYIDEYGKLKKLGVSNVKDLRKIAADIEELKKIIPEEKLLDQASKADDLLTALGKKTDWRKGLGVKDLIDPDNAREGVLKAAKAMRDVDDGVALLFDIDPDSPNALLDLSPTDQAKVLKRINEMLKFWEKEGASIYTAGAAYEPELITLIKKIKSDPELVKEVILNTDLSQFSPAALSVLLESLNQAGSGETGEVTKEVENEIERLRESREIPGNIIETLDKAAEDMEEKEDEDTIPIVEPIPDIIPDEDTKQEPEQEPDQEQEPEQEQKQDEGQEQEQEQDEEQEQKQKRILTLKEKKGQEDQKLGALRFYIGANRGFRVVFTYPRGGKESVRVQASSYPEAMSVAQGARQPKRDAPVEVNIWAT